MDWSRQRAGRPGPEQLWPEPKASEGKEGTSNVIQADEDEALTGARLVTLTPGKCVPMVFRCSVLLPNILAGQPTLDFVALARDETLVGAGSLEITYGSGSAKQTVVMDLRTGTYQIPPSEEVIVNVTTSENGSRIPAFTLMGSLTPGVHPIPTTPTYTHRIEALAPISGRTFQVPARARYVDMWLANSSETPIYGAGAPVLCLSGDISNPQLIRDYVTGIFMPPYPAACIVTGFDDAEGQATRLLHASTDVECEAVVQFYLEL